MVPFDLQRKIQSPALIYGKFFTRPGMPPDLREQVDSKVLKDFGGMYDAQFLTEIKKERPYFAVLAEKASETVDSILSSASAAKRASPSEPGVAKPRVSKPCVAAVVS